MSEFPSHDHQEEFTKRAFAQKMRLAKSYKIHPLAMLGAQLPQPTAPVYEGKSDNMGQNIAYAISKGASDYYTAKHTEKLDQLQLERAQLENDLLRSQIISINSPMRAGTAYSNDQKVLTLPDENIHRSNKDRGLTSGSDNPPPAGKKFTVGSTPFGDVHITLPASGQADEFGEVYGAIKGLEYLAKRGFVHLSNGKYRPTRKMLSNLKQQKVKKPKYTNHKNYTKLHF